MGKISSPDLSLSLECSSSTNTAHSLYSQLFVNDVDADGHWSAYVTITKLYYTSYILEHFFFNTPFMSGKTLILQIMINHQIFRV